MRELRNILAVVIMFVCTTDIHGQNQGASAFIPGCYQSYVMAFVDNDAAMEQISMVSTADKVAEMNGRKYKTLDAGEAGLGTLYFRQEGGKVYRLTDDGQGEILCYDFGLKPNEEFTAPDGTEWKVLSARDTVMNLPMRENYKTRLLTLCHKDNPGIQDTWQEGVGSWHYGPFTPDQLQSYASVAMLTCLMDNQVFEFDRPPLWSSFLSHPHSHSSADDEWKMKWMDKDSLTWKQVGDTLHISGFVYGFGGTGGLNARSYIHEGVARVYAVPMPRQSYLLNWYDVDLHVPCHGEEIKKVEVRGNDIPSSLRTISAGRQETAQTYDLQGHKVEGKPSRGIYVIGGKKRVVR